MSSKHTPVMRRPGVGAMFLCAGLLRGLFVLTLLLAAVGCGEDAPPTRDELFNKQMELPTVYLTINTNKEVIAPQAKGVFVDKESGEVAWPAVACHNPECPGRGPNGELFLFITPTPGLYAKPDGTVGVDSVHSAQGARNSSGLCPKCAEKFHLKSAEGEQRVKYLNFIHPYVLPETEEQMKQIEADRKRRIEYKPNR